MNAIFESTRFFTSLKGNLDKLRRHIGSGILRLFRDKKVNDSLFEELSEQLLIADVGIKTTEKIISELAYYAQRYRIKDSERLYNQIRKNLISILVDVEKPLKILEKKPFIILIIGVNGVGKTTTIGKLAWQIQSKRRSVMLAAGDTFRAAAIEQLQIWGEKIHVPVIAQRTGADSASVIFDAIQSAKARSIDVLIADTAGRLQNKVYLMEELKKIVRVIKKLDAEAPHEIMLILDASTGQNAISQTHLFNNAVQVTGISLTKLDSTAKGGVIFALADQFNIPVRYISVGENLEDLQTFKVDNFIEALFS